MALVPASSRATAFNGGTITEPLVIDLGALLPDSVPLTIKASYNAQNSNFFELVNSDTGNALTYLDNSGDINMRNSANILHARFGSTGAGGALILKTAAGAQVFSFVGSGAYFVNNLPAADPHVNGNLWNNLGLVTVSAG